MKKINLLLALMISTLSFAQDVKDQFTILKELGEGAKIMEYYSLRDDGKGGKTASIGNPFTLEFVKNKFNKIYGFSGKYAKQTTGTAPTVCDENYTPNHHTKPAFFYNESTLNPGIPTRKTNYFLIIDNVIYFISGEYSEIKAGGNYSLKREIYYIKGSNQENSSSETSNSQTGKKKKKGLLKGLLGGGSSSGGGLNQTIPKEITDRDHRKAIDEYLSSMKSMQIQTKLSKEESKEAFDILNDKLERAGKAKKANEEWEQWMAENSGGGNEKDRVTIKNTGAKVIKITACGSGYDIHPGDSKSFSSSCKITYAVLVGTMWKESSRIISNSSSNNGGKTVNIR